MNLPTSIKAAVFDFDGTIADSLPLCIEAFRQAARPFTGRDLSDAEITSTFGPSEEGTAMALVPEHAKEVTAAYLEAYDRLFHPMGVRLFDGMEDILRGLKKRGFIVGLVTGKGKPSCDISLKKLGLDVFFDTVKCGWAKSVKKDSDMLEILEEFNLEGRDAIYIGDVPSDVVCAHKARYTAIAALWNSKADVPAVLAEHPDAAFYSITEFKKYTDSLTPEK